MECGGTSTLQRAKGVAFLFAITRFLLYYWGKKNHSLYRELPYLEVRYIEFHCKIMDLFQRSYYNRFEEYVLFYKGYCSTAFVISRF